MCFHFTICNSWPLKKIINVLRIIPTTFNFLISMFYPSLEFFMQHNVNPSFIFIAFYVVATIFSNNLLQENKLVWKKKVSLENYSTVIFPSKLWKLCQWNLNLWFICLRDSHKYFPSKKLNNAESWKVEHYFVMPEKFLNK